MIRKLARPMLASVYVASGVDMVANPDKHRDGMEEMLNKLRTVLPYQYARRVPTDPELVSRGIGATQATAASLLTLGKAPRLSAGTLALLAVPTTLSRYAFWETQDPVEKESRRNGLVTSVALLGGLMIATADTAGKPGLKWRAEHVAKDANKKIQAALPTKSESEKMTANAQESAAVFAGTAKNFFQDAADKVGDYVETAQHYVEDNREDWLKAAQQNADAAKTNVVKAATIAQLKADEFAEKAADSSGKYQKKAVKAANLYQKKADKATTKAQKKLAKKIDI